MRSRRVSNKSGTTETASKVKLAAAALVKKPSLVELQIRMANVSNPVGRSRSVAGSSFMVERNRSAAPATDAPRGQRQGHAGERGPGPSAEAS